MRRSQRRRHASGRIALEEAHAATAAAGRVAARRRMLPRTGILRNGPLHASVTSSARAGLRGTTGRGNGVGAKSIEPILARGPVDVGQPTGSATAPICVDLAGDHDAHALQYDIPAGTTTTTGKRRRAAEMKRASPASAVRIDRAGDQDRSPARNDRQRASASADVSRTAKQYREQCWILGLIAAVVRPAIDRRRTAGPTRSLETGSAFSNGQVGRLTRRDCAATRAAGAPGGADVHDAVDRDCVVGDERERAPSGTILVRAADDGQLRIVLDRDHLVANDANRRTRGLRDDAAVAVNVQVRIQCA